MITGPMNDSTVPTIGLAEAADQLGVAETLVREWLASFNWERRYDVDGHLYLTARDLDFLRVVKSLREVDRSCDSISRIIQEEIITRHTIVLEGAAEAASTDWPAEAATEPPAGEPAARPPADPAGDGLAQIETLKAELLELQAKPTKKAFWRLW